MGICASKPGDPKSNKAPAAAATTAAAETGNVALPKNDSVTIVYWNMRGRAELARLLAHLTGLKYTNKPVNTPEEWGPIKASLQHTFPNLPYIEDAGTIVTESAALLQYIIEKTGKFDFRGKTNQDKAMVTALCNVIEDIRVSIVGNPFDQDIKTKLPENIKSEKTMTSLKKLNEILEGKKFLLGDYVTLADIYLYEYLVDILNTATPDVLDTLTNLKKHRESFRAIPEIKAYVESPDYQSWPHFSPMYPKA